MIPINNPCPTPRDLSPDGVSDVEEAALDPEADRLEAFVKTGREPAAMRGRGSLRGGRPQCKSFGPR
jgi:hypothetical protein